MARSFIEASKVEWHPEGNPSDGYPGHERIQLGCLQRIANSLEKMEQPFTKLLSDVEYLKRCHKELSASNQRMAKRIAAYRGVINKMKKSK
jgi:exonuclease VII small subunit